MKIMTVFCTCPFQELPELETCFPQDIIHTIVQPLLQLPAPCMRQTQYVGNFTLVNQI